MCLPRLSSWRGPICPKRPRRREPGPSARPPDPSPKRQRGPPCSRFGLVVFAPAMSELAALQERAFGELRACADEGAARAWNTRYFGDQGEVTLALKKVGTLPREQRPEYGRQANLVKQALTTA